MFQQFRTAAGEEMVLNQNFFVEQLLQGHDNPPSIRRGNE
jgi:hypothetical protein